MSRKTKQKKKQAKQVYTHTGSRKKRGELVIVFHCNRMECGQECSLCV